jgi:hypothetical protein
MHAALRLTLVVLTLGATAGTSRADWSYGNLPNPYATQLYYDAFGHGRRGVDQESSDTQPPAPRRPLKATDFKRANSRPVLDEFIASTGLEGGEADELRGVLEAQLASLEAPVRKNNVAAAMGVLFVTAYRVVNGIEIDDTSRDAVIAHLNDALAVQASFKKLKARARQEVADTVLVQAALIVLMTAQDDPAMKQVGVTGARSALRYLTGSETGNIESNPPTLDYGDVID